MNMFGEPLGTSPAPRCIFSSCHVPGTDVGAGTNVSKPPVPVLEDSQEGKGLKCHEGVGLEKASGVGEGVD